MPLVITLRNPTSIPIEVDTVRLEDVRGLAPDHVRALPVQYGNRQPTLGEFFDVRGSAADDQHVIWEGDCGKVKLIGAGLSTGRITVDGNAGMHLGAEMTGGEITVRGNAGDWVGAEMKGGRIRVLGNTGHLVGAVYRGGRRGMTGGEILITGDTGNELGHTMRRGLVVVGGKTGDAPGFNMLAGSLVLLGECGIRPGAGMKRGTIALLHPHAPPMLPTFKPGGMHRFAALDLLLRHVRALEFSVPEEYLNAAHLRYRGDFLELGRGEILVRQAS